MTKRLIGFLCLASAVAIAALTGQYIVAGLAYVGWLIYVDVSTEVPGWRAGR